MTSHRLSAGYNALVAKSSDGKLWFVRNVGVSLIDPHHLAFNERPPPVHIERVTANDRIYDATNGLEFRRVCATSRSTTRRSAWPPLRRCGSVTCSKDRTPMEGGRQR